MTRPPSVDAHDRLEAPAPAPAPRNADGPTPAPAPAPADPPAQPVAGAASTIPETARQYWIAMTVAERAEYGLPATGWGRALFGDAWGDDPRDQG
jgi:hypothetical protein